ncbi:23S rRNA (adenine(2030)-N(6))-methyltransferase RlmJ [Marinomonas sp. 2405UD68-3]|uniref:23S rRNA (adenine(2030)-N(6))-methyltransferase RlmJ n=1 Tax=Marinomonas sp. 2405UD68-3 TaxID=3391835 RepID=UPI0039C94BD1
MLSYRHIYHAGNHADILKHIIVSQICQHFTKKEAPFFYLDTHAGIGEYPLASIQAQKNKEFESGIAKLIAAKKLPEPIEEFVNIVQSMNAQNELLTYPGSPKVVAHYQRQKDKMHLCELHPNDFPILAGHFPNKRKANVQKGDGFAAVKAMLPPPQKRGFVLMDPPYEVKKDYQAVVSALLDGYKRFPTGTYAIWYPVLSRRQADSLINSIKSKGIRNTLLIELLIRDADADQGMNGSGMIITNPPWTLETKAKQYLPTLASILGENSNAAFQVRWITPE